MAKVKISVSSFSGKNGCSLFAMQIAFFIASDGDNYVRFIDNQKNPLIDKILFDSDEHICNNVHFCKILEEDEKENEVVICDLGDITREYIDSSAYDKNFLIVNAKTDEFNLIEQRLANNFGTYDIILIDGTKDDVTVYKPLAKKVISVNSPDSFMCCYDLKMNLDLFSHIIGVDFPDPGNEYALDDVFKIVKSGQEEGAEEKNKNKFLFGKKHHNSDSEAAYSGLSESVKESTDSMKRSTDSTATDNTKSDFDENDAENSIKKQRKTGSKETKLSRKERREEKKLEKAAREYNSASCEVKENKKEKNKGKKKRIITKDDYARKIQDLKDNTRVLSNVFTIVNILLIVAFVGILVSIGTGYRDKCHEPVKTEDIIVTKIPAESSVCGVQLKNYSGVAKNKKVALIIGNDTFVRPMSENLKSVKNKSTVKTKRYEIVVSFTDNPLKGYMYGDLSFVHYSVLGEGEFSQKDIASILEYAQKYYTKKRYDFFKFNDKDSINLDNPPISLIQDVES